MFTRERERNNAAQDTILRLALAMWAADVRSTCTPAQRAWIITRLQSRAPLSREERAKLHGPLFAWYAQTYPASASIVQRQFAEVAHATS